MIERIGKFALAACALALAAAPSPIWAQTSPSANIRNSQVWIALACGQGCLWKFSTLNGTASYSFAPPTFSIDGNETLADTGTFAAIGNPVKLANGVTQYLFESALRSDSQLKLRIQFQVNEETPVIRFRYTLMTERARKLTAASGKDRLTYFKTSLAQFPEVEEVSLSNFAELTHSYTLNETKLGERYFADGSSFMGPILAASNGTRSFLIAYEHGSQVPDAFLQYQLAPDRTVRLTAVKGNYLPGQVIDSSNSYESIWMESAAVDGPIDQLASAYRRFVLHSMSQNPTTRHPYIFYNTWNFQERNKWLNGKPYLASMNEDHILKEIDVAHRMGIDVFVLDTGWYEKTGDWAVSTARFPNQLKNVKARLDAYGMKLGLWFGPTSAAVSSKAVREHPQWRMSWNGKIGEPREIWETEKSYEMCMVSGYADYFADELIRLAKEVGVSYFKWDAISQYGCNDPHHNHGGENNTQQESADSYAFQLVQSMSHVAEKVAAAVPGTIVDFDVTEGGRAFGLAFLSSGKFFLINNGPYYQNYDVPIDLEKSNWNLFFNQGPARTWITRSPLTFDKWIPSVLFLTHYFPDDPRQWQEVNVASLILGQNGIWGDLLSVSDDGVDFIGSSLARYKQVRNDITESDPVVTGLVSGSPEIYEKISSSTGKGAVVIFATHPGDYEYVTSHKAVTQHWNSDGVTIHFDGSGRATIQAQFEKPGAKILFFGVK